MKAQKRSRLAILASIMSVFPMLASPAALAEGTRGSGGSTVFVEGKWELADVFTGSKEAPGEMLKLSDEMREYLDAIERLLSLYDVESERYWDEVKGNASEYRYVESLPCAGDRFELNETGLESVMFGCTKDGITYLKRDLFERLPFRVKALGLMHERLHALSPEAKHESITSFIKATNTLIRIKEQQNAGKLRKLSKHEVATIEAIYPATASIEGFEPISAPTRIWPNGGGQVEQDEEFRSDAEAFVGIGSSVTAKSSALGKSIILDSMITRASVVIDSFVANSQISSQPDKPNSFVSLSHVKDSAIHSSEVIGVRLQGSSAVTDGSSIRAGGCSGHYAVELEQASISRIQLHLQAGCETGAGVKFEKGSSVHGLGLVVNDAGHLTFRSGILILSPHVGINRCKSAIATPTSVGSNEELEKLCQVELPRAFWLR